MEGLSVDGEESGRFGYLVVLFLCWFLGRHLDTFLRAEECGILRG